ncbi:MAG: hypothetical protein HKN35_00585 [Woeseia sp.]|nr:hypothetical protein [Woeseia sp.]
MRQFALLPVGRAMLTSLFFGLLLAGCGGGGGSDGGGGNTGETNVAPVASAGTDQTVTEQTTVQLLGSGSDANSGDQLTYAWTQTAGTEVALTNPNQPTASFVAPDVQPNTPETLTFQLTVTDDSGLSGNDGVSVTTVEGSATVTISGAARYEFVPPNPNCFGLNYNAIEVRPIRGATIQIFDATSGAEIARDVTGEDGGYAFTVDGGTDVFLRVVSELKRTGASGWDVEIRDNTANTSSPLQARPKYVLDSSVFNAGGADQSRTLTAATGWGGNSYNEPRAAAPFAVMDAIYSAMLLVLSADAGATFPPLDAYWSVNNRSTPGASAFDEEDIKNGDLVTSFYRTDIDALFLLGQANEDTEEFDDHVIVHEWGHYFEDNFSRTDTVGGPHGQGDRLDMRLAFGEGWATALSGIALDNPNYCDTQGPRQASGFIIDIENGTSSPRGFFSEFSVLELIYDLWDDTVELGGGDTGSVPWSSIYRTMVDRQAVTPAHTSIFSFMQELQDEDSSSMALLNDLRAFHDINGTGIYGDGETNDAGSSEPDDVIPVYTDISTNGVPVKICSNRQHDSGASGNKLSEYRFLRMTITIPSRYEFDIVTDAATVAELPANDPANQSDPNLLFYRNGQIQNVFVNGQPQGRSTEANRENFTTPNILQPGDYVMDVVEFRHTDPNTDRNEFPARSCFDMTINPSA